MVVESHSRKGEPCWMSRWISRVNLGQSSTVVRSSAQPQAKQSKSARSFFTSVLKGQWLCHTSPVSGDYSEQL